MLETDLDYTMYPKFVSWEALDDLQKGVKVHLNPSVEQLFGLDDADL
jgi:hypothetical protein